MSTHVSIWPRPTRIGGDVLRLLNGSISLLRGVVRQMVDDGEEATQTVKLSYRGVDYEVDLSERNAAALDDALAPYLDAGRPVTAARSSRARATKSGGNAPSPNDVRTWAKSHGIKVADRGRLSADVTHRYRQAHRG